MASPPLLMRIGQSLTTCSAAANTIVEVWSRPKKIMSLGEKSDRVNYRLILGKHTGDLGPCEAESGGTGTAFSLVTGEPSLQSPNENAVKSGPSTSEQGPGAGEDVACIRRCEGLSMGIEGGIHQTRNPHTVRNPQSSRSGAEDNLPIALELHANMFDEGDKSAKRAAGRRRRISNRILSETLPPRREITRERDERIGRIGGPRNVQLEIQVGEMLVLGTVVRCRLSRIQRPP
ncbi:hypothetical protein F5141DRAFT_1205299 [Pisolithus sp. B1]|nr:hypothetical protein F5141DRAFT_1205299 [Pisolithus sp. B1]